MGWKDAPLVSAPRPAAGAGSWRDAPVLTPPVRPAWSGRSYLDAASDVGIGVGKGVGNTAIGFGRAIHAIPGFSGGLDDILSQPGASRAALDDASAAMEPSNTTQRLAMGAEQVAEFAFLPGPAKVKGAARALEMAKGGAGAAGLAAAQGASGWESAAAGVLGGVPVVEGVAAAGRWAGEKAPGLVRAAIKPTVTAMKRVAGASFEGIEAKANQLVNFIIENKVTTAEKAKTIVAEAERELQRVLSVKNAPTDAPTRALRYLDALEKSAAKQALPASDVGILKDAAGEVLRSGLGEDLLVKGSNGQWVVQRIPRADVTATEALERARATSRWDTRKSWGEQKGASTEASKAVERALRDSVKEAVPEAKPILQRQGKGIQAKEVLDRMEFRTGNRDAVSLPAWAVAGAEVAQGKIPFLAAAANYLRNNQMKIGIYADSLGKAIQSRDTGRVVSILHRLGVGTGSQLTSSATAGR